MPHIRPDSLVQTGLFFSDLGIPDRENAAICGVAVKTIRRWHRLYQRQGIPRGHVGTPCPRCDGAPLDSEAYAYLLGLYLGDGHIATTSNGTQRLFIFQDPKYPGLIQEAARAMATVKPSSRRANVDDTRACVRISCYWMHWTCLFPQHGPGLKHTRRIALEAWQGEVVEDRAEPFLRGLIHSDGCRFTNWTSKTVGGQPKRYEYPRYMFTNKSTDILGLCSWALDLLGICWAYSRTDTISVARKAAVAAMDEFIGPKH